jgi:hypothetical protein
LKYDIRGVESGQDFDEPIPKGVYRMSILSCIQTKSSKGNDMLELELEIIKGKFKGRRVWDYVVLTKKSEWKLASLVRALGLKEKGGLNPEKLTGKTLTAKVKLETYTTEDDDGDEVTKVTNKIASLLPKADAEEAEEEEPEEEEEEEEAEEPDEEEEEEDGDEEGYTEEEINEADKAALKEIISDEELGIRVTKKTKVAALRKKVLEALEEAELMEEAEEPDEEEEEEGDEDEAGYDEMSLAELKAELKERELKVGGKKPALIKRLEADDEEEEGEGEDDDGDEPF